MLDKFIKIENKLMLPEVVETLYAPPQFTLHIYSNGDLNFSNNVFGCKIKVAV